MIPRCALFLLAVGDPPSLHMTRWRGMDQQPGGDRDERGECKCSLTSDGIYSVIWAKQFTTKKSRATKSAAVPSEGQIKNISRDRKRQREWCTTFEIDYSYGMSKHYVVMELSFTRRGSQSASTIETSPISVDSNNTVHGVKAKPKRTAFLLNILPHHDETTKPRLRRSGTTVADDLHSRIGSRAAYYD
jgi:hypothetical protein